MSDLPYATLFMLMSTDGKISTGFGDKRDFDKDLPHVMCANEGLQQYYDLEQQTDAASLNTGKVMAKVGWNKDKENIEKIPVSFVIVDNKPHLSVQGIVNLLKRSEKLYIVTTNDKHPAKSIEDDNLQCLHYEDDIDFMDLFNKLKARGVDRITIQSGGEMNSILMRLGLVNEMSIVVAPIVVGGAETPTLVDGKSLMEDVELTNIKALELIDATKLNSSYLHLRYKVQ